jgi:hypothetical protein
MTIVQSGIYGSVEWDPASRRLFTLLRSMHVFLAAPFPFTQGLDSPPLNVVLVAGMRLCGCAPCTVRLFGTACTHATSAHTHVVLRCRQRTPLFPLSSVALSLGLYVLVSLAEAAPGVTALSHKTTTSAPDDRPSRT